METNKDLTTKEIPLLLRQLAIPSSTGLLFNTLYNVVDTFYATLISTQAVAALSLSFMIFFLIVGAGYGLATGLSALIGNSLGKKRLKLSKYYAHQGFIIIPFFGFILSIFGLFYAKELLVILGAKDDYLQDALDYIYIILLGTWFFVGNFTLNSILVATGDTKSYRNSLIFGFFANIVLNPLFIYGFLFIPAMGIKGIALATVLIQLINMLYLLKKVLNTKLLCFDNIIYFLPDNRVVSQIIKQGLPASANMFFMSIGSIFIIYFVSHYGVNAVAGYGIAFRVEQLLLLPALGISTAVLTLVSNNYGAKKYDRVKQTLQYAMKFGCAICVFGALFLYIFGKLIVGLFTYDSVVLSYALEYLYIEVLVFFAFLILFICVSTLQGIKEPKMVFYVALYRQIFAKFIIAFIIVHYFDLEIFWLWIGLSLMTYSAAIFLFLYTKYRLKKLLV